MRWGRRDITEQRVFVSIPLEKHFKKVFEKYRDANGRIPYLRWTPERNLHITVLFVGGVSSGHVEAMREILAVVLSQHSAFGLTLRKVTYAPPERQADMVWAYFEPNNALDALVSSVHGAMQDLQLEPADTYKNGRDVVTPHITLARFKKGNPPRELIHLPRTELEGHQMLVEEVQLVESKQTKKGADYTVLETFELCCEG
jgi:2'-5' RNA ligase